MIQPIGTNGADDRIEDREGRLIDILRTKRGSQMVEAAVSLPIIILAAMLLIRLFVFYLEILTTGIERHKEVMEQQDAYRGAFIRTHSDEEEVSLLRGGLLMMDVSKRLEIKAYMINEDMLVRSGEILGR